MPKKINVSKEEEEKIVSLFKLNKTKKEIENVTGFSLDVINRVLEENKIFKPVNWSLYNFTLEDLVYDFFTLKESLTSLSKKYGVRRQTLSNILKRSGYEVVNRQNATKFNQHVFDVIDTEEKAYWLGFIFADGYVSSTNYTFELSLSIKDKKHLEKFNSFMEYNGNNVKINNSKCNEKTYKRCRWSITNKHLWNTLNKYGCIPKKSLKITFPDKTIFSDESLIRHFIRGYFDGDGCISRNISTSNKNKIASLVITILGTEEFLMSILDYSKISNFYIRNISKENKITKEVRIHTKDHLNFLNYLYKDSFIYLDRKYKKYVLFFIEDCRSLEKFNEE